MVNFGFTATGPINGLRLLTAASLSLFLAGCGSGGAVSDSGQPPGAPDAVAYQELMVFSAAESGLAIDPMMFHSKPGSAAGVGPLAIRHISGIAPVEHTDPATSRLLAADGTPLGITLGQWQKAAGTVRFHCSGSNERATSTLTGLIPAATYSTFIVHTDRNGPARFTPWGDRTGSTNNFTSSATGTASPNNTVHGCPGYGDDIIIIWHSDGHTHGSRPGQIGVNWHTSLIARVPSS
jgi:hypothetical protein